MTNEFLRDAKFAAFPRQADADMRRVRIEDRAAMTVVRRALIHHRVFAAPDQTVVELEDSIKSAQDLMELVLGLERLPRIRHVLKNQQVSVRLHKKSEDETVALQYTEPRNPLKTWEFLVPKELQDGEVSPPVLTLRYFQRPLDKESFIDVQDSISSVADLNVSKYDGRPFSKYLNGSLTLKKLLSSSAVKENRKGLEEGDDLTDAIEGFLKDCVYRVVTEVEEEQRKKERERRLIASNAKMKELFALFGLDEADVSLDLGPLGQLV